MIQMDSPVATSKAMSDCGIGKDIAFSSTRGRADVPSTGIGLQVVASTPLFKAKGKEQSWMTFAQCDILSRGLNLNGRADAWRGF